MTTTYSHADLARIATRLPAEEDPEFQIAPMIDILLVLLVFFMSISSTEVLRKTEGLTLPVAAEAGAMKNGEQMIVNVLWVGANASGTIEVDNVTYEKAELLVPKLKARMEINPQTRVLIRADKNVPYQFLRKVMVAAGQAGAANVAFSVVDKEQP